MRWRQWGHGMLCPARELGVIEPFIAMLKFGTTARHLKCLVRGWCECAYGAFGHGMPCSY